MYVMLCNVVQQVMYYMVCCSYMLCIFMSQLCRMMLCTGMEWNVCMQACRYGERERELVSETFLLVNMYQFLLTMFFWIKKWIFSFGLDLEICSFLTVYSLYRWLTVGCIQVAIRSYCRCLFVCASSPGRREVWPIVWLMQVEAGRLHGWKVFNLGLVFGFHLATGPFFTTHFKTDVPVFFSKIATFPSGNKNCQPCNNLVVYKADFPAFQDHTPCSTVFKQRMHHSPKLPTSWCKW